MEENIQVFFSDNKWSFIDNEKKSQEDISI